MLDKNKVYNMDCIEGMKLLDDNSIDSIITDPPYELEFMGKKWDNTGIAFDVNTWKEALRVCKPGAMLFAFGGCYDDKTEILTKEGWKYFKEVTKKDLVATINPENDIIEYQYPKEVVNYNNYKELYHFKTNKIDLMVTPNHKMMVKTLGIKNSKWKLEKAENINSPIRMKKMVYGMVLNKNFLLFLLFSKILVIIH